MMQHNDLSGICAVMQAHTQDMNTAEESGKTPDRLLKAHEGAADGGVGRHSSTYLVLKTPPELRN